MKKNIPNAILIVLLAVISVLVIYTKGEVPLKDTTGQAGNDANVSPETPPPKEDNTQVNYPLLSNKDDFYNYNQSYKNVENYHSFVTTHSDTFIILTKNNTLIISKIDEKLNILKEKNIGDNLIFKYAKLTVDGITIAYSQKDKIIILNLDLQLLEVGLITLPKGENVSIYSYNYSYIAVIDTQMYVINKNNVLNNATIKNIKSIDNIVQEDKGYAILAKKDTGYSLIKLDLYLKEIASIEIKNKEPLDLEIIVENKMSFYILSEKVNGNLFVSKFDKSFNLIDTLPFGEGTTLQLFVMENYLIATLIGKNSKIYYLSFSLSFELAKEEYLIGSTDILQNQLYKNTAFLLTTSDDGSTLLNLSRDTIKKNNFEKAEKINFIYNINDTISLLFYNEKTIKLINLTA